MATGTRSSNPIGTESDVTSGASSENSRRLQQAQAHVDEVVGIMRVNVEKVLERDHNLSEVNDRADALRQGAGQFEQQTTRLKRKYWWKNLKMIIIMGLIGIAVLIIIIVWITSEVGSGNDDDKQIKTINP